MTLDEQIDAACDAWIARNLMLEATPANIRAAAQWVSVEVGRRVILAPYDGGAEGIRFVGYVVPEEGAK